jgi:hypothetical protein
MNENLKKGALTELKCQMFLIENDFIISKPILDNARYDLLLDYNNKIYKIQIKTSRWNKEGETIVFNCKSQHSVADGNKIMKYSPEEIDYFMTEWDNQFYLIPCLKEKTQFTLRLHDPNNNARFIKDLHWAKDYLALEVIKTL